MLQNNRFRLDSIEVGSSAEEEHLEAGDVLLEVNGRNAREFSMFELRVLFCRAGETVKLKVQQGDDVRALNVTLRDY